MRRWRVVSPSFRNPTDVNRHATLVLKQIWCSPTCQALYIGRFWRRLPMASQFSRRDFLPAGLNADQVELVGNTVRIHSRSAKAAAACPRCGTVSRHVHSSYRRRPPDLPAHGRKVELVLLVRRFRCRALRRPAKIFAERFPPDVTRPYARRTSRLQGLVRHLGLVLGGHPAQALTSDRAALSVRNGPFFRNKSGPSARGLNLWVIFVTWHCLTLQSIASCVAAICQTRRCGLGQR